MPLTRRLIQRPPGRSLARSAGRLSLGLLCLGLLGCGLLSGDDPVREVAPSELSFRLNGEPWPNTAGARVGLNDYGLGVLAAYQIPDRFPLQQLFGFSVPEARVGRFPLTQRVGDEPYRTFMAESEGDVSYATYEPVSPDAGFIEVTSYDEETGEIAGRFEAVLVVTPGDVNAPYRELPDTLRITDGEFFGVVNDAYPNID